MKFLGHHNCSNVTMIKSCQCTEQEKKLYIDFNKEYFITNILYKLSFLNLSQNTQCFLFLRLLWFSFQVNLDG